MTLAAVILAGGASRRMGFPKPLLELEGVTLLDRLIDAFLPCCDPVIVVLGHDAERIRAGARRLEHTTVVVNPEPERGQLSSLQCALRAVPGDTGGVIFTPVDFPRLQPSTVAALAQGFRDQSAPTPVLLPACNGRSGHPVCIRRELVAEILELPPEGQARDVIRRYRERTALVEVSDPGILRDADTPEAFRALGERVE